MIEIWHLFWAVPFCLTLGMIFGEIFGFWNGKCGEIRQIRKKPEEAESETGFASEDESLRRADKNERDPMSLRNGYGVTRSKDPTFAEQWVNIMNFSGESQTEVDYEESEGDYPAEDMG